MISFGTIAGQFDLELEPNFSALLRDYVAGLPGGMAPVEREVPILERLGSGKLSLIGLKDMYGRLPARGSWSGPPFLKAGEQLSLTHTEAPECAGAPGYTLLKAMFNQSAPNDMYRVAWAYIAEDAERKYGVLFIERQREEQEKDESAVYEFQSFIYLKAQDRVTHYSHHFDHFLLEKSLRMQLVFMGFGNTGNLITECNQGANPMLLFKFQNIFNSIINPLYRFVQSGPAKGR